jgi:hypothetical protein
LFFSNTATATRQGAFNQFLVPLSFVFARPSLVAAPVHEVAEGALGAVVATHLAVYEKARLAIAGGVQCGTD